MDCMGKEIRGLMKGLGNVEGNRKKRRKSFKSGYIGPKNKRGGKTNIWKTATGAVLILLGCIILSLAIGGIRMADSWNWQGKNAGTQQERPVGKRREILKATESEAVEEQSDISNGICLTEEEYEILAKLVTAEAEDQGVTAQYMVACTVMNRVKSEYFPDDLKQVIWQKEPAEQFVSVWNGRFEKCSTTEECYEAVQYLVDNGNLLPGDVLYFTSNGYLPGTIPYRQVNNMYFSRQK